MYPLWYTYAIFPFALLVGHQFQKGQAKPIESMKKLGNYEFKGFFRKSHAEDNEFIFKTIRWEQIQVLENVSYPSPLPSSLIE